MTTKQANTHFMDYQQQNLEILLSNSVQGICNYQEAMIEIVALEKKLDNLTQYRLRSVPEGTRKETIEKLDAAILFTSTELERKRSLGTSAKKEASNGLRSFVMETASTIKNSRNEIQDNMKSVLKSYVETIMRKHGEDIQKIEKAISTIKEEKIDVIDNYKLFATIKDTEEKLTSTYGYKLEELRLQNKEAFKSLHLQSDSILKEWDGLKNAQKDNILLNNVSRRVMNMLQEQTPSLFQPQPETLDPVKIQKLIAESPDLLKLKTQLDQVKSNTQSDISKNPIKQQAEQRDSTIRQLSEQLSELKAMQENTQSFVNALESSGTDLSNENIDKLRIISITNHVAEMSREMGLIRNKMSSMETMSSFRQNEMQRLSEKILSETSLESSRKRQRLDSTPTNTGDIDNRTQEIEKKITHIVDYIYQFRSTILNPSFPKQLDTSLKEIEKVLKNHEHFIAYLVDPIAASKEYEITTKKGSKLEGITNNAHLSPAMFEAINKTVEESVAEATRPLLQTIRSLQEKLDSQR
ncbi:hypothetical protein BDF14DRAFT_1778756 [Spinellus fusiger]|nr:hypothetical protein BDF14DRAFT_1778756 [Spinellus fusiger]